MKIFIYIIAYTSRVVIMFASLSLTIGCSIELYNSSLTANETTYLSSHLSHPAELNLMFLIVSLYAFVTVAKTLLKIEDNG